MSAAIIKRLDVAIDLILNRLQVVKLWVAAFDISISTQDVLFLQEKLINLCAIHSEYHTKIDERNDKIDERTAKVIKFDDIYDSIVVRVKRYNANAASSGSGASSSDDKSARIQLPTILLPRLNDAIGELVYFRDKFKALITLNTSLNLKPSLVDEAESLQSSNDTFTSLWNALKERFVVKRVIADKQILKLFNLKLITRDSASEHRHMIDVVVKSLRVLETMTASVQKHAKRSNFC
jgi:hypothetical protein